MSLSGDLQAAIVATPGLTLREVAGAVGLTTRGRITTIAALLSQLCKAGKLRKDSLLAVGATAHPRYWPTDLTGQDLRVPRAGARKAAAPKPAPAPRVRAPDKPAHVPRNPRYAKPTATQQFQVVAPPRQPRPAGARAAETVAEFIARGGQVQQLPPHATSHPLRFDHADPAIPPGRRRASVHHRRLGAP